MKRWQVVTVFGMDSRPHTWARTFTEAGGWRKARRLHHAGSWIGQHFACGDRLPLGCRAGDACDLRGWMEVRRVGDDRTMAEFLRDQLAGR